MWLVTCKLIKIKQNLKLAFPVSLATFHWFRSHMWPVVTLLDNTDLLWNTPLNSPGLETDPSVGEALYLMQVTYQT